MSDCTALVNNPNVITLDMFKLDLPPLSLILRKNREAHVDCLKQTKKHVDTLCEIVKQARALKPLDNSGPHDTQYCIEDPRQAFVEYASSRTDEAGGLVSEFMASQDARLSKFEANFKQQQSEMTNKIITVLKAITDQIAGTLPSDTVKNPKLSTTPVLSARSYTTIDPQ
ncbi:hypothetical protein Tco_0927233 [Tanacetum coccineum]